MTHNVCSNNAVAFAARKLCGDGRYQTTNFSRPKPQTNSRQKQWSDNNHSLPQIQFSHINKRSACPDTLLVGVVVAAVMCSAPHFLRPLPQFNSLRFQRLQVSLITLPDRLSSRSSAAIFAKALVSGRRSLFVVIWLSCYQVVYLIFQTQSLGSHN